MRICVVPEDLGFGQSRVLWEHCSQVAAAAAAAVVAADAAAAAVVSHQHSPQGNEAGRLLLLLLSSLEAGRNWLEACHHQPPYEEADECPLWAAGG